MPGLAPFPLLLRVADPIPKAKGRKACGWCFYSLASWGTEQGRKEWRVDPEIPSTIS